MSRRISVDDVVAMLTRLTLAHGMTLEEFARLGISDELRDCELRDAWLIWGWAAPEIGDQLDEA